jgi:hypothetical protein
MSSHRLALDPPHGPRAVLDQTLLDTAVRYTRESPPVEARGSAREQNVEGSTDAARYMEQLLLAARERDPSLSLSAGGVP